MRGSRREPYFWNSARGARAEAAVSLDEEEAERLVRFLADASAVPEQTEPSLR